MENDALLWKPPDEIIANANLTAYRHWLEKESHLRFEDYHSLWKWSVENSNAFW